VEWRKLPLLLVIATVAGTTRPEENAKRELHNTRRKIKGTTSKVKALMEAAKG
jgi:hypothetical protein